MGWVGSIEFALWWTYPNDDGVRNRLFMSWENRLVALLVEGNLIDDFAQYGSDRQLQVRLLSGRCFLKNSTVIRKSQYDAGDYLLYWWPFLCQPSSCLLTKWPRDPPLVSYAPRPMAPRSHFTTQTLRILCRQRDYWHETKVMRTSKSKSLFGQISPISCVILRRFHISISSQ